MMVCDLGRKLDGAAVVRVRIKSSDREKSGELVKGLECQDEEL